MQCFRVVSGMLMLLCTSCPSILSASNLHLHCVHGSRRDVIAMFPWLDRMFKTLQGVIDILLCAVGSNDSGSQIADVIGTHKGPPLSKDTVQSTDFLSKHVLVEVGCRLKRIALAIAMVCLHFLP